MGQGLGKRVMVVGAGIVGASLAYQLADKGATVTLVEAGDVASGVTSTSFAWLNTSHRGPDPIAALRGAALQAYRQLETQLPGLNIRWAGALSYGTTPHEAPHAVADMSGGNRVSRSQILDLEPNLNHPPRQAVYVAEEGALDAVAVTHALVAGAVAKGAQVLTQTRVLGFTTRDAQVIGIETATGMIPADVVVLAAGTGITSLTALLGVSLPIEASPAIFIRYTATPDLVRTLISSPDMEVRHGAPGTLLAAEDYVDDAPENQPAAIALRTASAIRRELRGVATLEPDMACVGLRPIPADRLPIIGYLPRVTGVYVCAMHPGVTLAAIVGRLASAEILDDQACSALEPCRPARFFSG